MTVINTYNWSQSSEIENEHWRCNHISYDRFGPLQL